MNQFLAVLVQNINYLKNLIFKILDVDFFNDYFKINFSLSFFDNNNFFKVIFNSNYLIGIFDLFTVKLFSYIYDVDLFYYCLKYYAIPFFILLIITVITALIITRYTYQKLIYPKKVLELRIDAFLVELIYSDYSSNLIKEKINLFKKNKTVPFKKKWCRKLIIDKIIELKQNFHGFNPNQILIIYKHFGFDQYDNKLIQNRKWHKKLEAIYHYQMLDYKIKTGYMRFYINSKNKFIKSNALIALMVLSEETFESLTDYKDKISRADEIKILNIVNEKEDNFPKDIDRWFSNKNNSIVLLGIKLMNQYSKPFELSQIAFLLTNKSKKVRKEIFLSIRESKMTQSNELLRVHYPTETNKRNKISLLKTLKVIGDSETKVFLSKLLLEEQDLDIKFEIVSCIYKLDKTFFENYKIDDELENNIQSRILLHINNPYLN